MKEDIENTKITFSIIIPTFNRAERLKVALNSLVDQIYKKFEVIVCDDGSTDHTKEIVDSFKDKLTIQYIWNENWGGPARPRNIGINASKAEWICFLDSDDWWYPEKLAICKNYCNDADLIYHDMDIYTPHEKKRLKLKGRPLHGNKFESLLLDRNAICNSSAVLRKTIVEKVGLISESKQLIAVEDYDYWLRIAKITHRFKYIPQCLGGYWVGAQNISISETQIERTIAVFDMHVNDLDPKNQAEAKIRLYYRLGRLWHQFGNKKKAIHFYRNTLKSNNKNYVIKALIFLTVLAFTPRSLWKKI